MKNGNRTIMPMADSPVDKTGEACECVWGMLPIVESAAYGRSALWKLGFPWRQDDRRVCGRHLSLTHFQLTSGQTAHPEKLPQA